MARASKWQTPPDDRAECIGCGYRRLLYISDAVQHQPPVWACHYCVEHEELRPKGENGKCLAYTTEVIHAYDKRPDRVLTTAERLFVENGRRKESKIKEVRK